MQGAGSLDQRVALVHLGLFCAHKTSLQAGGYCGHKIRPTLLVALAAALLGCASTPPARPLPPLPPPIDVGALIPPAPARLSIPSRVAHYPDRAVRAGTCGLPAGILVSPAVYAEGIWTATDRKRLAVEAEVLHRLRVTERQAAVDLETACRARVAELGRQLERAERLSGWRAAALVGFGALVGGVVAVLARPTGR